MKEQIKWDSSGPLEKKAIVELCGWCNIKGTATPTGKRIAKTIWAKLSPAASKVLLNHGVTQ